MAPHEVVEEPVSSGYSNNNGIESLKALRISSTPHPLDPLSIAECDQARIITLASRGADVLVKFRSIYMSEPAKQELLSFLEAESSTGISAQTPRPARLAHVQYDVVSKAGNVQFTESTIDLDLKKEVIYRPVGKPHHSALTT